jgi:acetylornithine deacetylase/succinyl-diaminopimelate desuccinylase-like protein
LLPDEDQDKFLAEVRRIVDDPAIEVNYTGPATRPAGAAANLESEAFRAIEAGIRRHYNVATLPTMSTGATDMAYLRAKGIQCYGIGPAGDAEDGPKGFGAHSDQERILESELHRFVRFTWDLVSSLARAS